MTTADTFFDVKPTEFSLTAGRILISVPFYNDPFFNRTVVLLTDYDEKSCAGLVLNKSSKLSVRKVISEIKVDDKLHIGGPVMPDGIFCIHNFENSKAASKLLPGIYVGSDEVLNWMWSNWNLLSGSENPMVWSNSTSTGLNCAVRL